MIQRFSVHFEDSQKIQEAIECLKSIGFAEGAIRTWREEITGHVSIHAYRDEDVDHMKRIDPKNMQDYCTVIWGRIGFARITLTEYVRPLEPIECDRDDHSNWMLG